LSASVRFLRVYVSRTLLDVRAPDSGAQPIVSKCRKLSLAVNGEIYNHSRLRAACPEYTFKTYSDCEVIIPLVRIPLSLSVRGFIRRAQYKKHDKALCGMLDGMFSFVLLDESVQPARVIAARDPIGITTLYQGWSSKHPDAVYFASEMKCLVDECDKIIPFPPGHVFDSADGSTTRYFDPSWWAGDGPGAVPPSTPADLTLLRETLEAAVKKRLMSEVPYGVLLSGGLDSSVIAAIAARETEKLARTQAEKRRRMAGRMSSPPRSRSQTPAAGAAGDDDGARVERQLCPLC
jgi:asparagine synthase (glutamine-hydrolysing)